MGKTFIAIMLIRYMTSLPSFQAEHKLVVFLAPTVALVEQQSEAVRSHTPLKVATYTGDTEGIDFWVTAKWQAELERADCVVMTPQIWLNCLLHGYWPIDRIELMILDECHHCAKSHPYNKIMQEYHRYKESRAPSDPLPHILGMTASPIFNPNNPGMDMAHLEANMDAVIVTTKAEKNEASQYVLKPTELPLYYSIEQHYTNETDFEVLLEDLEIWDLIEKEDKVRRRVENIKGTLGNLACDIYICNWLKSLCDPTATKESLRKIRASGRIPEVAKLANKMERHLQKMPYFQLGHVSDKVKVLINLLTKYETKRDFHAIVFVQQRHHAQALAFILGKSQSLQRFLRPEHFVGHGASGVERLASEGMQSAYQRRAVQAFRDSITNLLVATDVAEEGLDFPACNLIVRFDTMATYKGYIQSRGRARRKDSEFVVMLQRDTIEHHNYLRYAHAEPQLDSMYEQRHVEDDPEEAELENTPRYVVEKTGATLTYGSAIALLETVCAILPSDAYSPPSKAEYKLTQLFPPYKCEVRLPMMPLLPPNERKIEGPEIQTKRGAKQAVAFKACRTLHQYGILDDFLLPLREGRGDNARDADDELVDRTVLPLHSETLASNPFGNMWSEGGKSIWLNEIRYESNTGESTVFGFICGAALNLQDHLTMYEPGQSRSVTVRSLRQIKWSDSQREEYMKKLDTFTRWVVMQSINRKEIKGHLLYFIAPLTYKSFGYDIDWNVVNTPYSDLRSVDEVKPNNLIIAPWNFMRKHIFTVHAVRHDLNSRNMPRITGLTKRGRIFERTATFGEALVALLDYEGVDASAVDFDAVMLHLQPCFSIRNNLNPIKAASNPAIPASDVRMAATVTEANSTATSSNVLEGNEDLIIPQWELPDWKWRTYKTQQHDVDDDADDMVEPGTLGQLQALEAGKSTANEADMTNAFVLPWTLCKVSHIPVAVWNGFSWLPSLTRAIHDQARAQNAIRALQLPAISIPLVIQALTLPMCCTGKDYQTLETIGDSALKLAVTVYVYNRYMAKDEGGLSARRMNSVDNQHLRLKAMKKDLSQHVFTEFHRMRTWVPATLENGTLAADGLSSLRVVPRRALSDCIEALLGAAYLSGGFDAVLRAGDALGLCFGGPVPWNERYETDHQLRRIPVGQALKPLQDQLGYTFKHGQLLQQALTHRSFSNASTHCQEREEFLGDAVLDNFVIDRLSRRFPTATPSHLTRLRSVLVSNSALGYLALRFMGLQRYILHSAPLLGEHFTRALKEAQQLDHEDFVHEIWLFDPPKPAADALEGVIGAIFIDSGWQVSVVFEVLDKVFEDLFALLPHKEAAPRDPTSRLRLFLAHKRCRDFEIKAHPRPDISLPAMVTVTWHGREQSRIAHHSQSSAKQLACKVALASIMHVEESGDFGKVCRCSNEAEEKMKMLREWRKIAEAEAKANDLLPSVQTREGREVDEAMEDDLGRKATIARDVEELLAQMSMQEDFGYDPDVPEEPDYDDSQTETADDATNEMDGMVLDVPISDTDQNAMNANKRKRVESAQTAEVDLIQFDDDEDDCLVVK